MIAIGAVWNAYSQRGKCKQPNTSDWLEEDHEHFADEAGYQYDNKYGMIGRRYVLRPQPPRSIEHLYTMIEQLVLTQFPMRKGLKIFGEAGTKAVIRATALSKSDTAISPWQTNQSREGRCAKISNVPEEKRTGNIKGWDVQIVKNNVNIQTSKMKDNTITLVSLMQSCLIDYMQNQDIATVETPGALLQEIWTTKWCT